MCNSEAAYEFTTESHGTVALCESHAARLRSVLEYTPNLSRHQAALLVSAKRDLEQAAELDPGLEGVGQNLQAVNSLLSQFKVK